MANNRRLIGDLTVHYRILLLAITLAAGLAAAPLSISGEYCEWSNGCVPGTLLTSTVAVDTTIGAVEFPNFHGVSFDIGDSGFLLTLVEPASGGQYWAFHVPLGQTWGFSGDGAVFAVPPGVTVQFLNELQDSSGRFFGGRAYILAASPTRAFDPLLDNTLTGVPEPVSSSLFFVGLALIGIVRRFAGRGGLHKLPKSIYADLG